jgi:glyoxylase-like metal-dependent hydrolase (beta-lactamase superfamily II)
MLGKGDGTPAPAGYGGWVQVAEGVHRLGSRYVNFYAIEEGGRVTIVDGGLSGYHDQVPKLLGELGRALHDVVAIVQTHVHRDHVGITERLRAESGATVHVHEVEGPILTGDEKLHGPKGARKIVTSVNAYRVIGHMLKNGGTRYPTVKEVSTFTDGEVLNVPGRLRVIYTPGHSAGHCSLLLQRLGVLFVGDAMITRDLRGNTGPRLMELNFDEDAARDTLDRFDDVDAQLLLPGHGESWSGSPSEAAALARSS